MLIAAFKSLWIQFIVISGILAVCSVAVWIVDGRSAAIQLLDLSIKRMKGPWVWTFGFGLAWFIMHRGRMLPAALDGVLVSNETTASVVARIERSTLHRSAYRYTVPITLLGVFLTAMYGIPSKGVAYPLVFLGVCSIYYIAAFILFHFIEMTLAFHGLFESMDAVAFRQVYNPLHLENLTTYLALTTALGLMAIYAGFRGTLTAGFQFQHDLWRTFLSTPVILFLPGTLFYNYYPRYVLRKIVQHKVFRAMERLGSADEANAKALLMNLKESAFVNSQILPFVDYKSLPSYFIAIFFVVSLAYNHDPAVKAFVKYLLDLGSP
ncbi:MAG: hypothetical protein HY735_31235 [Verrucomicrobia bacterium]|nr:hypothetical protein [Verrucomicrobiota bacterium]